MNIDKFCDATHGALYPGKHPDPEHPDNRENRDFLAGYAEGYAYGSDHARWVDEWELRGSPSGSQPAWSDWKRGRNAGMIRRAAEHAQKAQAETVPYAYCCNGDPATCDCVNPDHGTARQNNPLVP